MSLYAAIDIGTNTTRLLVGEVSGGKVLPRNIIMRTTRLGEGLQETGLLKETAMQRTIDVLQEYCHFLSRYPGINIGVVATSAARDAGNREQFVEMVKESTGLQVQVISGEQEAALSYWGVTSGLDGIEKPVVLDIGGGSTELMYASGEGKVIACSAPVGAVRCTESPTTPSEILEAIKPSLEEIKNLPGYNLVGVGGTITTLSAIDMELAVYDPRKIHGSMLSLETVGRILFKLAGMSLAARKRVPGLEANRADIIVAGALILWVIMTFLNQGAIQVSEADILHGIILSLDVSRVG